jgi:hypothetical protein
MPLRFGSPREPHATLCTVELEQVCVPVEQLVAGKRVALGSARSVWVAAATKSWRRRGVHLMLASGGTPGGARSNGESASAALVRLAGERQDE